MYYLDDPIILLNRIYKLIKHFGYQSTISNDNNDDIKLVINGFKSDSIYGTSEWTYYINKYKYNHTLRKFIKSIVIERCSNISGDINTSYLYLCESPLSHKLREYSEKNWIILTLLVLIPGSEFEKIINSIGLDSNLISEENYSYIERHVRLALYEI